MKPVSSARKRLNDRPMARDLKTQNLRRTLLRSDSFGQLVNPTIGRSSSTNMARVGMRVSFAGPYITNMPPDLHSMRCGKGPNEEYVYLRRDA
jgi:hypothetical protein